MSQQIDTIEIAKIIKESLGEDWNANLVMLAGEPSYEIDVFTKLKLKDVHRLDHVEALTSVFKQMTSRLKNTELFQSNKNQVQKEMDSKVQEIEELKSEVERLQQFETYYYMTMDMQHGNRPVTKLNVTESK